jgi:hypothetical protein
MHRIKQHLYSITSSAKGKQRRGIMMAIQKDHLAQAV